MFNVNNAGDEFITGFIFHLIKIANYSIANILKSTDFDFYDWLINMVFTPNSLAVLATGRPAFSIRLEIHFFIGHINTITGSPVFN